MNNNKREKLFEKIYSKLPTIKCKGLCHEACGPISATRFEAERLEKATGKELSVDATLTCSMLTEEKRCAGYEQRPLVCRLFGLVPEMKCPFGCLPSRFLTRQEAFNIHKNVIELGGESVVSKFPQTKE